MYDCQSRTFVGDICRGSMAGYTIAKVEPSSVIFVVVPWQAIRLLK